MSINKLSKGHPTTNLENTIAPFGFVYVATGSAYVSEAIKSATSLRRHHPDSPICLITDCVPQDIRPFSEIRAPKGPVAYKPIDKILAYESPYENVIFLDTDTHVIGDLLPVRELLHRFDLALLQDVNRGWNYQLPDVPLAFSEFNTGVIAFRKSDSVRGFFCDWRREYVKLRSELSLVNDQPSFRRTLYHSSLRVSPLPSEFHFLGDFPNSTLWKVRLIHGRGDYSRIAHQINETLGLRAYVPELGAFPGYLGRKRLIKSMLRFLGRACKLLLRGPQSVTAHHPSKWWNEEGKPSPTSTKESNR